MEKKNSTRRIRFNTMQKIAIGFFGVIFAGGVLLWLPVCNQKPIAFFDSLFTSVSAVCVTGLVTIVPAEQFTLLGKIILMLLIQIGGLGIIACTVAFFLLLRRKITMKDRIVIQQAYGLDTLSGLVKFVIRILKGTLIVEGIGAVLFAMAFIPQYGVRDGIGYSLFHSISAFCNAGIDILGSNSFMDYVSSPIVNFTTMFLIVAGGLGFPVWHDIHMNSSRVIKGKEPKIRLWRRLGLQSKVVLTMTALLLILGTVGYFFLEYSNPETMGDLNLGDKLMASGFQSVTTRTAGYATIPQAELTAGSRMLGCILMLIGGSPCGTAGGVKTTTMAMLLLTVISVLRGRKDTECFGRKIEDSNVRTGIAIVFVTCVLWIAGILVITVLEPGTDYLDIMYEATSAVGTVGLSANLTPALERGSQAVLMVLMYAGRIGPMTMALVFAGKARAGTQLRELPEKRIMLG